MPKVISQFEGEHAFLSNFYPSQVMYHGLPYPTVEHAYQAAKTADIFERSKIRVAATPGEAKKLGRLVTMTPQWEFIKSSVMLALVREKFLGKSTPSRELLIKLLATADAQLVEGNNWHDNIWGDCWCSNIGPCSQPGQNLLGRILMCVRDHDA